MTIPPPCFNPARKMISLKRFAVCSLFALSLAGCSDDDDMSMPAETFSLNFKAMAMGMEVNCDNAIAGMGPEGKYTLGVGDLRFYVSDLTFYNANGEAVAAVMDENSFQLNHEAGSVALVDFSSKSGDVQANDFCQNVEEGTPRANTVITGQFTSSEPINAVSFAVGVPQPLMKAAIANTDNVNDAPSPLNEMYWSWASGYRHFVMNFTAMDDANTLMATNSNIHIGSRGCKLESSAKALTEKDACDLVNTPTVMLEEFDLSSNNIVVDLTPLINSLQDSDFSSDDWAMFDDESQCIDDRRNGDYCVIGTQFGVQCHASMGQSACANLFPVLGLNLSDGSADAAANLVFVKE